jgi:hypothetical protein
MAGTQALIGSRLGHRVWALALVVASVMVLMIATATQTVAQQTDRRWIRINEGVIEPLPFAVPMFIAQTEAMGPVAREITRLVGADLVGTGLFREIPQRAHIGRISTFDAAVQFPDWRAINAQALITGAVSREAFGRISVQFRLFDVVSGQTNGAAWRTRCLMPFMPASPVRQDISTAAWRLSLRPAQRMPASSGWR